MKVYILIAEYVYEEEIKGVYFDRESAEKAEKQLEWFGGRVEEWEVQ